MKEPKHYKERINVTLISVIVGTALVTCSVVLSYVKFTEAEETKKALNTANEKIKALSEEIGTAITTAEQARKEAAPLNVEIAELKSEIEAFAKQAKSCDDLKKKLNAKR